MSRKQLIVLFVCSLLSWMLGNGLFPLLPIYAGQLGADPAQVGVYMALAFAALTAGSLFAGWLADRLQRRKALLIAAGVAHAPVYMLMRLASNAAQLAALVSVLWFIAGMIVAPIGALAGLFAENSQRGKVFGLLGTTTPVGAVIGRLAAGPIADHWGFPTLFVIFAIVAGLVPLTASALDDKPSARRANAARALKPSTPGAGFHLLLVASVATGTALFVGRLSTSLAMNEQGFLSSAISSTTAVGGLVALPLPMQLGWLSDRTGRKWVLAGCYLAGAAGLGLLSASESLGQFWMVSSLLSIMSSSGSSVGSALIADLVPRAALGNGLSAFNAMSWIGGMIGFAVTGYVIQIAGLAVMCGAGAFAALGFARRPEAEGTTFKLGISSAEKDCFPVR